MSRVLLTICCFLLFASLVRADNVMFPDVNTDAGLLVRLFNAECKNPGYKAYNVDDAKKSMKAMKAVVYNRLKNNPALFGAPGATSYVDIVGAPDQFAGFTKRNGKIAISGAVQKRIDDVIRNANTGRPGKFATFVQSAIDIAKADVEDPFKEIKKIRDIELVGGTFGWRAAGAADPGGQLVPIPSEKGGVIAGNKFYTLKK
jgi:hypothetical protein